MQRLRTCPILGRNDSLCHTQFLVCEEAHCSETSALFTENFSPFPSFPGFVDGEAGRAEGELGYLEGGIASRCVPGYLVSSPRCLGWAASPATEDHSFLRLGGRNPPVACTICTMSI